MLRYGLWQGRPGESVNACVTISAEGVTDDYHCDQGGRTYWYGSLVAGWWV